MVQPMDFSSIRQQTSALQQVAANHNPAGDFVGGALKGMELARQARRDKMDREKHKAGMEAHERQGTLQDLNIKLTEAKVEDMPGKRAHESRMREQDIKGKQLSNEGQRLQNKERLRKLEETTAFNSFDYATSGGMANAMATMIERAPDQESRQQAARQAQLMLERNPVLGEFLADYEITGSEDDVEHLRNLSSMLTETSDQVRGAATGVRTNGDIVQLGPDGKDKVVKTAQQQREESYSPRPNISHPRTEEIANDYSAAIDAAIERVVGAAPGNIDGMKDREARKYVAGWAQGIIEERKRLSIDARNINEVFEEAAAMAFPPHTIQQDGTTWARGRPKVSYDPNRYIDQGTFSDGSGIDVQAVVKDIRSDGSGARSFLVEARDADGSVERVWVPENEYNNRFRSAR